MRLPYFQTPPKRFLGRVPVPPVTVVKKIEVFAIKCLKVRLHPLQLLDVARATRTAVPVAPDAQAG